MPGAGGLLSLVFSLGEIARVRKGLRRLRKRAPKVRKEEKRRTFHTQD